MDPGMKSGLLWNRFIQCGAHDRPISGCRIGPDGGGAVVSDHQNPDRRGQGHVSIAWSADINLGGEFAERHSLPSANVRQGVPHLGFQSE